MMDPIINHLKTSKHILVASHTNPDGDAIGSLIAMGLALEALGKKATLYNESPIPTVYRFLPRVDSIVNKLPSDHEFDTTIILDCGELDRIGAAAKQAGQTPALINIDHHTTNDGFGQWRLVDTSACATAEIVYRLIKELNVAFTQELAVCIYTAILTDTGSFRFLNTTSSAFAICDEMVANGVEPYKIAQHVYGTFSIGRLRLLNLALDSIEISLNGKLSMMTVTQRMLKDTETYPEDADGFINYARRIKAVRVAALIQELQNEKGRSNGKRKFHVSLRSDGTVDVADIAASFGGGGHVAAAGFNLDTTLVEMKKTLWQLADKL